MATMHFPKAFVTVAAAGLIGAAGGAAVVGVAGDGGTTTTTTVQRDAAKQVPIASTSSRALTASQVYDLAKGSVVFITASGSPADPTGGSPGGGQATGSGFVIDADGLIVTNAHVVSGASSVEVKIGDRDTQPARIVGVDQSTDLALLRVETGGLTPLELADSSKLSVGDQVYAIGNPFGLDRTLTAGLVSALQRSITAPNGFSIHDVVQTDAPINPGNSGGPLLDAHGRVVGVNSQILNGGGSSSAGNVGIGFAVSSNTVRTVVEQLERDGKVKHAYLGVQSGPADGGGAQVGAVTPGGPAEQGGVRAGDVIVGFDGERVDDPSDLSRLVSGKQAGDEVRLTVKRDGGEQTLAVRLGEQPASASDAARKAQLQPQEPQEPRQPGGPDGAQPQQPGPGAGPAIPEQLQELLEQLMR